MLEWTLLLGAGFESFVGPLLFIGIPALILVFLMMFFVSRYRRCPSNRVLVIFGKVAEGRTAKCVHGGGTMVWPVIQDYQYMSLEPMTLEIDLTSALSKQNIRVNVPSSFTIAVSTQQEIMQNAAERLLGQTENEIKNKASDIILGQLRLVIATLSIEEINQDREKFLDLITKNVGYELNKIGLMMINVNIRDITDESGYIDAIGKKAASIAINQAKVEVAEAEREGSIGEAAANRGKIVEVSNQAAKAEAGKKQAERDQRIALAKLEAEGVAGESNSKREQEIVIAQQGAMTVEGSKKADSEQRVQVALLEAEAVKGENMSQAEIADYQATLAERQADAKRRGEVARALAARDVLQAEKEQEQAKLEKEQIVQQMIERKKVEIDAEAEAERIRRIAKGEADATLAKYNAEAEGVRAVLDSKAAGYEKLLVMCGDDKYLAPTLLMVEQMPTLVAEQVKAIQNLKIDKITVWDSGNGAQGEGGSTSNFLKSLIGSLPPMQELAQQAGIELPSILGTVADAAEASETPKAPEGKSGVGDGKGGKQ